jgi:hypothetical protein
MHPAVSFCPKFSLGCFVIALAAICKLNPGTFVFCSVKIVITLQWKMFNTAALMPKVLLSLDLVAICDFMKSIGISRPAIKSH